MKGRRAAAPRKAINTRDQPNVPDLTGAVLDPEVETTSGLRHVSYAVCNNLLTVAQARAHHRLEELAAAVREIEEKIKLALDLP